MSLMSSFYTVNMASKFLNMMGINTRDFTEPIKECLISAKNEFLMSVASNVAPETINDFVTKKVEVDTNLSMTEINERTELVDKFTSIVETAGSTGVNGETNKLENITEAILASPDEWGQILVSANVTPEVLDNMASAIENGESISDDLVNIACGAATGAVVDMVEKYSNTDEQQTENEYEPLSSPEESMENTDVSLAEKRGAQAAEIYDTSSYASNESLYGFD